MRAMSDDAIKVSRDINWDLNNSTAIQLALLADIASDNGKDIFPSVRRMAWSLGSHDCADDRPPNERTIQRHLEELIDLGIITFVGWHRNKTLLSATNRQRSPGPGYTAEYQMFEDALPYRRPFEDRYVPQKTPAGSIGDILSPMLDFEDFDL